MIICSLCVAIQIWQIEHRYLSLIYKYTMYTRWNRDSQPNKERPTSDVKTPAHANLVAHDLQSHDFAMLILKVTTTRSTQYHQDFWNSTFSLDFFPPRPLPSSLPEFVQFAFLSRYLMRAQKTVPKRWARKKGGRRKEKSLGQRKRMGQKG